MKKKIGILTQPLHDNYGGLLQAYALKTTLERLGHDVQIINRRRDTVSFEYSVKKFIKGLLGRGPKFKLTGEQQSVISQHTNYFAKTYIKDITLPVYSTEGLKKIAANYDVYVVGSDQVWRPRYSPQITNYYLDFIEGSDKKGLAYAASFGVDEWEYTEKDTKACRQHIHNFKAISVREDSAVDLCLNYLGADAVHVIDPTMLLEKDDYIGLIRKENEDQAPGNLMCYILDDQQDKQYLINEVSAAFDLKVFAANPPQKVGSGPIEDMADFIFPKVTYWLNGFNSAEFVITDSFHGTVFSILFNKPFLVVANIKRGKARFESLLKMFKLEDRLITDAREMHREKILNMKPVDWDSVNSILVKKRQFAMDFLRTNL